MDHSTGLTTLVCCICGVNIEPNLSYKCLPCIRQEHDMAADVNKEISIYQCRGCERYLDPPAHWINAPMQSREQLSYCLKRIRGLEKFHLINAVFQNTEIHSKRIKIELTVQKEIDGGAVLEQSFVVEFIVGNQFCTDCHRVEAKDYWKACIQIRQKINHRRTLFYLEQLMLKNGITANTTSAKFLDTGMDLFFANESDARRVVDFISSSVICKVNVSKKLISHDCKSNIYNNKYSFCVELAPVCKDDLICLSPSLARNFGGISPICLVARAARQLQLIDANTAQTYEVNTLAYYKNPFVHIASSKSLEQFIVMETEETDVRYFAGQGKISRKHTVCDVWVQRVSQMGTDTKIFCRTHLGGILNIGDIVLGYDLLNCNMNSDEVDKLKESQVPDVVLVKKYYGSKNLRDRKRKWKLTTITQDEKRDENKDYRDFLEDLEEDANLRKHVNIYKDKTKQNLAVEPQPLEGEDPLDEDVPVIDVAEMLEELDIADVPMADDSASPSALEDVDME